MDLFEQFQDFLANLKKEPEEAIRQVYEIFNAEIGELLAETIVKQGEVIELGVGDLLFSEDSVRPHVGTRSQIFVVLSGQVIARKKITESSYEKTMYEKGDVVGVEKLISWVGEKINLFSNSLYRETAMAGSNNTMVIGLTAEQCISFLRVYPKVLIAQLKHWIERASEAEQRLVEFAQVAKGMELDLQTMSNVEKVILQLIEEGEIEIIAGVFVKLKKTLDEYNNFFLDLEKASREKDEKILDLQEKFKGASYAFWELLKIFPEKTSQFSFTPAQPGNPHLDEIIESLFAALREKNK
jgi:hypothetical protein